ncbi:MAG: hypothetical protein ACKOEC_18620 [Acidimicrobiia bacterium]
MKRLLAIFALIAGLASPSIAQTQTLKRTLVDNMCQMKMKTDHGALAKHTRECALMDSCIKSGYAVVTDSGMVFKLDAKGNEQAVAALKASKQEANLKVTVAGAVKDGMVSVTSFMLDKM